MPDPETTIRAHTPFAHCHYQDYTVPVREQVFECKALVRGTASSGVVSVHARICASMNVCVLISVCALGYTIHVRTPPNLSMHASMLPVRVRARVTSVRERVSLFALNVPELLHVS